VKVPRAAANFPKGGGRADMPRPPGANLGRLISLNFPIPLQFSPGARISLGGRGGGGGGCGKWVPGGTLHGQARDMHQAVLTIAVTL
jgi:hypothetical protein